MRSILVALILTASLVPVTSEAQPTTQSPELAKQRELNLARLREYRLAGKFASDDQGRPASVFRDKDGRLCPMAHLIAASGHMDLVDQVARENNRLQLADVTSGPLWDWMLTSGLTREEIVRIQGIARLGYDFERPIIPVPREQPAPILASTALATPPSPAVLRREMAKRAAAVERELSMHTAVSLAVAESRLPQKQTVAESRRR